MAETNNTELEVYDQLMNVQKCVNALKDVSENMPDDDRYVSVLSIVTERLEQEHKQLTVMALSAIRNSSDSLSEAQQTRSDCTAVS